MTVVVTDGVEVVFLMIGTVTVGNRDTVLTDFVDLEPYLVKHTSWVYVEDAASAEPAAPTTMRTVRNSIVRMSQLR